MEIYLLKDDQPTGPFSIEEVRKMLAAGLMSPMDNVWHAGLPQWVPAGELEPTQAHVPASGSDNTTAVPTKACPSCGVANSQSANFCCHCGISIKPASLPPPLPVEFTRMAADSHESGGMQSFLGTARRLGFHFNAKICAGLSIILILAAVVLYPIAVSLNKSDESPHPVELVKVDYGPVNQDAVVKSDGGKRQFEVQGLIWAGNDVRFGWNNGTIVRPPSNGELAYLANNRWVIFQMSDDCQQIRKPETDMEAAKEWWVDSYKKQYVQELKPLIEEARHARAPVF